LLSNDDDSISDGRHGVIKSFSSILEGKPLSWFSNFL